MIDIGTLFEMLFCDGICCNCQTRSRDYYFKMIFPKTREPVLLCPTCTRELTRVFNKNFETLDRLEGGNDVENI